MVAIELDVPHQERLDQLAKSVGSDSAQLARQILVDYLDFQALPPDTEEGWAEASVKMAAEAMDPESWDEPNNGSK